MFPRTLRESFEELKHETEASGRIHIGLAQKLLDDIHRTVKEFREQQRDTRKRVRGGLMWSRGKGIVKRYKGWGWVRVRGDQQVRGGQQVRDKGLSKS